MILSYLIITGFILSFVKETQCFWMNKGEGIVVEIFHLKFKSLFQNDKGLHISNLHLITILRFMNVIFCFEVESYPTKSL